MCRGQLAPDYPNANTKVYHDLTNDKSDTIIVDDNYYFVLGDYRNHSTDSREFGAIPHSSIIGKAEFILLSKEDFLGKSFSYIN